MADLTSPPLSKPLMRLRALLSAPQTGGQRRLRMSMYLAFLALAVGIGVQGFLALRQEALRASDAVILDLAGEQRSRTQQIGRASCRERVSLNV